MGETIFTDHIRSLLTGRPDDGQRVRSHLRAVICKELHRLGHWDFPPSFLGYSGASWNNSEALDDLVQDAYVVCIFKRLKKLAEYLRASGKIEGAVHWKLQRFLLDCQRNSNPARTRIFNNVKGCSVSLVARGLATAHTGSAFNSATTLLARGKSQPSSLEQLADLLAPELSDKEFLAAVSRECPSSRELIENTLLEKFATGLTGYQIGVLVQLLSSASILSCEIAGLNAAHNFCATDFIADFLPDFRMLAPEVRYEQTEDFNNVKETLANHVRATIRSPRIQARVIKLIDYLAELIRGGEDMRLMTQAEIARRLGVSYSTLNEDFVRLRSSKVVPFIAEANSES